MACLVCASTLCHGHPSCVPSLHSPHLTDFSRLLVSENSSLQYTDMNDVMSTFEVDLLLAKCRSSFADFNLLPRAIPLMVGCDSSLDDMMLDFLFSCNPFGCRLNVMKHVFRRFPWCFSFTRSMLAIKICLETCLPHVNLRQIIF